MDPEQCQRNQSTREAQAHCGPGAVPEKPIHKRSSRTLRGTARPSKPEPTPSSIRTTDKEQLGRVGWKHIIYHSVRRIKITQDQHEEKG